MENEFDSLEFMRKNRFEKIKDQFKEISLEAQEIINNAEAQDILSLTLTFNSPNLKVIKAEIFDEKKFIDLAF